LDITQVWENVVTDREVKENGGNEIKYPNYMYVVDLIVLTAQYPEVEIYLNSHPRCPPNDCPFRQPPSPAQEGCPAHNPSSGLQSSGSRGRCSRFSTGRSHEWSSWVVVALVIRSLDITWLTASLVVDQIKLSAVEDLTVDGSGG